MRFPEADNWLGEKATRTVRSRLARHLWGVRRSMQHYRRLGRPDLAYEVRHTFAEEIMELGRQVFPK